MKTRQCLLIRNRALILLLLLASVILSSPGQTDFFYSFEGEKIELEIMPGRFVIKPAEPISVEQVRQNLLPSLTGLSASPIAGLLSEGFIEIVVDKLERDLVRTLEMIGTMRLDPEWLVVNPVYSIEGSSLIPYDVFVVYIEDEAVMDDLEQLNYRYDVELIDRDIFLPNIVTLRVKSQEKYTVTEMARLYYENLPLRWSVPDFKQEIVRNSNPSDVYYPYQFYLFMTSTPQAWNITKGSQSVIVAVIDDGVMAHQDLPSSRLVAGYDAFGQSGGAPGGNEAHGMAVAGIIAATHNDVGIAGIAPNVKIMPVRIFNDRGRGTTDALIRSAFSFAVNNGAHVINNSWAYNTSQDINPQLTTIIQTAMQTGRGGKGTIIVFAAGNNGGSIRYPANISGVITVGAIDQNNTVFSYSARGSQLDVVAPSGLTGQHISSIQCDGLSRTTIRLRGDVWTLDHNGQPGYNPGNYKISAPDCYNEWVWTSHSGKPVPNMRYTSHFGGTSAAAPQVSAVAALMLSKNPNLTLTQVRNILRQSADKVPGMGGQNFTNEYGYGRLNSYKALLYPFTVTISGPAVLTTNDCATYISNVIGGSGNLSYLWKLYGNSVGNNSTFHFCPSFPTVYSLVLEVTDQILGGPVTDQMNITVNDPGVPGPDPPQFVDGTEILQLPDEYAIYSNYPNPFNPITTIRYELPEPSYVTLVIYDMMGREVCRLVNDVVQPGYHTAMWDSRNNTGNVVASGMYLYRFTATPAGGESEFTGITKSNTMLLVK